MPKKFINKLKKFTEWMFFDRVIVLSIVIGIIFLFLTLILFGKRIDLIKYRGMEYCPGGTTYSRLLFKMSTPALTVKVLLKRMYIGKIPWYLILYSLMFIVQIIVYGIVGKVASIMSSNRTVTVCICIGIALLALALAYEINPAQSSVVDMVRGKPFYLLLTISNLPAFFAGQYLTGVFGRTAILYLILFPSMFIVQIILYGFFGKVLSSMSPSG